MEVQQNMIAVFALASMLCFAEPEVPPAETVEQVLATGWNSPSVYGTTAPYDFLTSTEPSVDGTFSYRIYVDPLYESYTPCFDAEVEAVLSDSRGWGNLRRAAPDENPQIWVILAPPGVARCGEESTPYGSCARHGNGHGRAYISAARWVVGYEPLADVGYSRTKLINHEVGHILGHGHKACTVMGYFPVHPEVEGGGTDHKDIRTCVPPAWPIRMVADSRV